MPNVLARFDNAKRRRPEDHARQVMLTPEYVLAPIRQLFGGRIGLDPCTESDNPTNAERFYCLPQDGCDLPWDATTVFVNPPYGEVRDRWVERCISEGRQRKVILLMPSHTDTRTSQKALTACRSVLFVKGRIKYGVKRENGRQMAASHGSALFGFGVDLSSLRRLGKVLKPCW